MGDESQRTKDRSPNFPFITLEIALQRAQQFFAKEKRGAAPFKAAALHWGYSPLSSGGMQTVAALKNYGLMSDEGGGAQRTLKLTDLALRILLDQRPDSKERLDYIREAAANPVVSQEVYGKWGLDLPSMPTLLHYLVLERSFNDSSAHKVAKIIYENHDFGRFNLSLASGYAEDKIGDKEVKAAAAHGAAVANSASASARGTTLGLGAPPMATHQSVATERVIAPDAAVFMEFSATPTWETYDFLESYMKLRKSVLQKKADNMRINVNEPYELHFWANKLGVDEQLLREAVLEVGPLAVDVSIYLLK